MGGMEEAPIDLNNVKFIQVLVSNNVETSKNYRVDLAPSTKLGEIKNFTSMRLRFSEIRTVEINGIIHKNLEQTVGDLIENIPYNEEIRINLRYHILYQKNIFLCFNDVFEFIGLLLKTFFFVKYFYRNSNDFYSFEIALVIIGLYNSLTF